MINQQRVVFLLCAGLTSVDGHLAEEYLNQLLRIQVGVGGKNLGIISK